MIELWSEQVAVIEKVRQAFRDGHRSILIVAPTGSGKTVIGADILRSSNENQKASMFMAHRRELVKQSADKLIKFNVPHGIIMAGFKGDMWKGVQVASIDTLRARYMNPKKKHLPALPKISILMVDEAHRSCSKTYTKLIDYYRENGAFIAHAPSTASTRACCWERCALAIRCRRCDASADPESTRPSDWKRSDRL